MSAIKLLLTSKIPTVDMIGDRTTSWSLLLVAPVLHSHTHCGHIGLGTGAGVCLDELVEESGLPPIRCPHYQHLHVVVRDTASVAGF